MIEPDVPAPGDSAPRGRVAVVIAVITLLCTLGICGSLFALRGPLADVAGCPRDLKPKVSGVVSDVDRIRQLLPNLGDLRSVHYQWREMRPRTCPDLGPMDYAYAGFVEFGEARAAQLRQAYPWAPASAPDVPAVLAPFTPPSTAWLRSSAADSTLGAEVWLADGSAIGYFTYVRR